MSILKINETPVRTSRNFNINNVKLEDIQIPENLKEFKGTTIVQNNSNIKLSSNIEKYDITYGLGDFFTNQVLEKANKNINIEIDGSDEKNINIDNILSSDNLNLIDNVKILANENSKATIVIKYKSDKNIESFHNGIIKIIAKNNSNINIIIVNLLSETSNNFLSIDAELEESSKIKAMGFDNLSTYGIMSDYSKDTIKDLIYFLITEGYIECVGNKYPILVLNKSANEVLFKNKQVLIKRKIEKIEKEKNNNQKDEINYDASLFEILRALRKKVAEKNNIAPFIVFTDLSLKQMAEKYPTSKEEMLKISGVGINKYENYGEDFILAINNYVLENNINKEINNEEKSKKSSSKKSDKIDTKIITYNMYKEGKSIEEIAKERGFTKQTIEHHLLANFENGLDIDLEKNINMKYKSQVFKAIDEIGYDKLRPIKDMVPADVTYLDIGYFVILYKKEKNS